MVLKVGVGNCAVLASSPFTYWLIGHNKTDSTVLLDEVYLEKGEGEEKEKEVGELLQVFRWMVVDGGLINQMEFKRKNHWELRGESLILVLKCSCL